jgi:hypothetical protein
MGLCPMRTVAAGGEAVRLGDQGRNASQPAAGVRVWDFLGCRKHQYLSKEMAFLIITVGRVRMRSFPACRSTMRWFLIVTDPVVRDLYALASLVFRIRFVHLPAMLTAMYSVCLRRLHLAESRFVGIPCWIQRAADPETCAPVAAKAISTTRAMFATQRRAI